MREEVVGAWSISWKEKDCVSIYDGLKNSGANMQYFACGGPETELNEEEIQKAGEYGDVIVAVVGELISMSGEASSRADITLPGCQREMLKKLAATGKPVVAVLMNGRPLALDWEAGNLPAIVEGWHLGIQMGNAIAEVLFGEKNPEGKLTSTFPVMTGQCPIYYNHPNTGRPGSRSKFTSRYLDAGYEPLYVFGYGLSYTDFSYSDLGITDSGDALEIRVSVQNTGACKGRETVQLYMQDVTASLVRPVRELKDFAKVELDANETKQVEFCLKKQNMGFYDNQGKYVCEDGLFRIYVGGNSRDCLMQECEVKFI
jgi:beta-glucosidase